MGKGHGSYQRCEDGPVIPPQIRFGPFTRPEPNPDRASGKNDSCEACGNNLWSPVIVGPWLIHIQGCQLDWDRVQDVEDFGVVTVDYPLTLKFCTW